MKEKKKEKKRHRASYADFEDEKFLHWPKADSFHIGYYSLMCVEGEVIVPVHKGFSFITKRENFFLEKMPCSNYNFLH